MLIIILVFANCPPYIRAALHVFSFPVISQTTTTTAAAAAAPQDPTRNWPDYVRK